MPMMPYTKKPAISYLLYTFYAVVMAVIYGLITYFGIFARGAEGFALRTYIWNLVLITMVLLVDRLYLAKPKKKVKRLHFVSFKASLYLFYIFALVTSRLMLLLDDGQMVAAYSFQNYLLSIEYGLILLVAADKFIDQFAKDKKQMKALI
ncbi:MAG: hypothetical protein FWC71_11285 [Defluviitaleaceae bacterium]|nr:hypothetical protein [Defluviitaleaceae bacterium]